MYFGEIYGGGRNLWRREKILKYSKKKHTNFHYALNKNKKRKQIKLLRDKKTSVDRNLISE